MSNYIFESPKSKLPFVAKYWDYYPELGWVREKGKGTACEKELTSDASLVTPPGMVGLGALLSCPHPSRFLLGKTQAFREADNRNLIYTYQANCWNWIALIIKSQEGESWNFLASRIPVLLEFCFSSSLSSVPMYYSLRISYTYKIYSWFCFSREPWLIQCW